jgi:thiosulfate/3-mercaptopyruvate sulfurtransferase
LAEIPVNAKNGGRHPLPSFRKICRGFAKLGINYDSHVVIYDDKMVLMQLQDLVDC